MALVTIARDLMMLFERSPQGVATGSCEANVPPLGGGTPSLSIITKHQRKMGGHARGALALRAGVD
jgi:hypothetical protein